MAELKYWLWLRSLRGLGNSVCLRLLQYFGSPERIYYAEREDYAQVEKITRAQIEVLADKGLDRAEEILADCTRLGLRILTYSDAAYPERLRAIPDAPCLLYYQGNWPDFDSEPAVALIGTRRATPYGVRIGERLGYELTKGGAYVVSGLAAGGDAAGHRGALMAGGATAAVLGGGIDVIYPAENRPLFSDIAASGVLISEYPPGTEAKGHHFLERNRIISGLSVAVVVTEAALRSGTMNTVHHALEQDRDVYAVPGPVDGPFSQGCNRMIQEGAGVVTCGWDLLRELQLRFPGKIDAKLFPLPPTVGRGPEETAAEPAEERPRPETKSGQPFDKTPEKEYIELKKSQDRFTDDQIRILLTLSERPMIVDDLAEETQIPVRRVLSALTFLELEQVVHKESGNRYTLNAVIEE